MLPSYKPFSSLTIWRRAFRCSGVTSSCFDKYHNVGVTPDPRSNACLSRKVRLRYNDRENRHARNPEVIDGEGVTSNTRWTYSRATCGGSRACAGYPNSQPSSACLMAWRLTSAMDSVSGISFGQILTQFCALAQSATPPGTITASSRSRACMAPVGCRLNRRTWLMMAAPMKLFLSFTWGHTSRHAPQEMQRESG